MNRLHRARAAKGKLHFLDREEFDREVAALGECNVEVIVRKFRPKRSISANRYYFGVVLKMLSNYTGYTVGELHALLKSELLFCEFDQNGEPIESTADLSSKQFTEYVEECRRFAADLGVDVPDPRSVEV
jgi:hypothetical protein